MKTDSEIKIEGFQALASKLDPVELERFIMLINREKRDYTKWRKNLFQGMSIPELSAAAEKHSQDRYG